LHTLPRKSRARAAIRRGLEPREARAPRRIVSLVPSITETLCEFGLARNIVGITDYCVSPARPLRARARVGGPMNPSIKKILSLKPDIVFASDEENRKQDVAALRRHGVRVHVCRVRGVEDAIAMMRDIFVMWPYSTKSFKIIRETESLRLKRLKAPPFPATRVAYLIWKNPYMACGGDTYISRLITVCGGLNAFWPRRRRYFALTLGGLARAKPQLVLLSTEPYEFQKKDCMEIAAGLRERGLENCRVRIVDGAMLAWYGARTRDALRRLPALLRV
jgi:ABC-type hemin transport system substrate-binding protein